MAPSGIITILVITIIITIIVIINIIHILRTNPNVEDLGSMGQYAPPHQGSSFSEGSPYERGKDNSTASSSRWKTPSSPNTHSSRTLLASHGTLENYANTFYHEAARLKNLDQWLTSNDEVDFLPSTPPSLLTCSEENMSGGKNQKIVANCSKIQSGYPPTVHSLQPFINPVA